MILETQLISIRENIFQKLQNLFKDKAIESHVFGSTARGTADPYSDIDIWYTFKDEEFDEVFNIRFEYYKDIGNIIHFCEAPQNAPENGVHTALLIGSKNNTVITVVDVYLCPLSTAFTIDEAKKLYGIDLPLGTHGAGSKKVQIDENYRIDFFIGFMFNTIKKMVRNEPKRFDAVLREYKNLKENYGIPVEDLINTEQNSTLLEEIMNNIIKVGNQRQKEIIEIIRMFARNVIS